MGLPHVEQNSLNSTGRVFSDAGKSGSMARRVFSASACAAVSTPPHTAVITALGAVKHAPGARVLHHAPNSQSATPPDRDSPKSCRYSSICQLLPCVVAAAHVTPWAVSSTAQNGTKPRTGKLPTLPNRTLLAE